MIVRKTTMGVAIRVFISIYYLCLSLYIVVLAMWMQTQM